jgi:uncharacterized repeat protein (TIGR03803 family)
MGQKSLSLLLVEDYYGSVSVREVTVKTVLFIAAVMLGLGLSAQSQTFTTVYSFSGADGEEPTAGVIQDEVGNIYGTTARGGNLGCGGCGVVYELTTSGMETVLYAFGPDSGRPYAPAFRDKVGSIYGTTEQGGADVYGDVFKIGKSGNESVLHTFSGGSDGCYPLQGVIRGKANSLYGTTSDTFCSGLGTIFKVDEAGNYTLLHTFTGYPSDGAYPYYGHLLTDNSGNLYGVTTGGGSGRACKGCGVLYKLTPEGEVKILHNFAGGTSDGCFPQGSVSRDDAGNLYGTTLGCGSNNYGTIWKVSNAGKETILHNFAGGTSSDGCSPYAGVTHGSNGKLYGVTSKCGANGDGTLFELGANGRLTVLHSFDGSDGAVPYGEILRQTNGTLYGTTTIDGAHGSGTLWSYVP